jgi:Cd2+/Zn2+-exporting ATPase
MGGRGADLAIEVADLVILTDSPSRVTDGILQGKRTRRIVKENVILALGTKSAIVLLGVVGMATMWEAVFADVGVALIAVFNALRAMHGPGR